MQIKHSVTRRNNTDTTAASDTGHSAKPSAGRAGVPRYLQRDGDGALPPVSLTPPSLLTPVDPNARFRPDLGLHYQLDAPMREQLLEQLDPLRVLAGLSASATGGGVATAPAGGPVPASPVAAPPTSVVPAAAPESESPAPAPGPGTARAASPGDAVSAVLATGPVKLLLHSVKDQASQRFSSYWSGAGTGERIGFVTSSIVVGAGILAPVLGHRSTRDFALPLLNGVVLPVPGLPNYGLEFNFSPNAAMVGAHLDLGPMLPGWMGFGKGSMSPMGGPPQPQTAPPLQRDAEGGRHRCKGSRSVSGLRLAAALRCRRGCAARSSRRWVRTCPVCAYMTTPNPTRLRVA